MKKAKSTKQNGTDNISHKIKKQRKTTEITKKEEEIIPFKHSEILKNVENIAGHGLYATNSKKTILLQKFLMGDVLGMYIEKIRDNTIQVNPDEEISAVEMEKILKQ